MTCRLSCPTSLGRVRGLSESAGFSDTVVADGSAIVRTIADSLAATDAVTRIVGQTRTLADTAALADAVSQTPTAGSALSITQQPTTGIDDEGFPVQFVIHHPAGTPNVLITASLFSGTGLLIGSVTALTDALGDAYFTTLGINDLSIP